MTVNGLRQVIFFNCISVIVSVTVLQFQVKDTHIDGVVIIIERRNSLGFQENIFPLLCSPVVQLHMSPTIQWDIFLNSNGYLDFIKPLKLQDLPRITTIVIIILIPSKIFLKERVRKVKCFTEVLLIHYIM